MTDTRESRLDTIGFVALAIGLGLIQFTIVGAEIFLDLTGLVWLTVAVRDRRTPDVPAFFLPLLVLTAWTLLGAVFSVSPADSFLRARQMLWFLVVPATVRFARGPRAMSTLNVIIAFGAVGALIGVFEFAVLHDNQLNDRVHGLLGHYMTYAGIIMLVLGAAIARLVFYAKERVWPAIAVPALIAALGLSYARNAWMGAAAAAVVVLALRRWKFALIVPIVVVLLAIAAPAAVKARLRTIGDLNDATSRDRIAMLKSGVHIVRDHPVFGVGMNMIPRVYPQYRTPDAVDPANAVGPQTRSHLHNVPMQLAAERGLPALAIWLWFVAVALRDLIRQTKRGPAPALAAVGVASIVAMFVAGLFEYNFGDSEFLILFLALITLSYAAMRGEASRT